MSPSLIRVGMCTLPCQPITWFLLWFQYLFICNLFNAQIIFAITAWPSQLPWRHCSSLELGETGSYQDPIHSLRLTLVTYHLNRSLNQIKRSYYYQPPLTASLPRQPSSALAFCKSLIQSSLFNAEFLKFLSLKSWCHFPHNSPSQIRSSNYSFTFWPGVK